MRRLRRPGGPGPPDPFAVLGLPGEPELTDDDVRVAWRRIATATHPDRADGGDPARFAEAAAAYTVLRTRFGRGEALADLAAVRHSQAARFRHWLPRPSAPSQPSAQPRSSERPPRSRPQARPGGHPSQSRRQAPRLFLPNDRWLAARRLWSRARRGRPLRLALRICLAAGVGAASAVAVGTAPATPAVIVGVLTWLGLTARHDLAPPP